MWQDDLHGAFYIAWKDIRAYYFKPPNISWGILFPFAFVLAFSIRNPGNLSEMAPGLLALTLLFGTTSMEAVVMAFERRVGSLERLLLAPIRLPGLLAGKMLGGMAFGLMVAIVVLIIAIVFLGVSIANWLLLVVGLLLAALTFAALGVFVSVSVREVFEAQTLANFIRFPMMFLGGIFVPVASMPIGLQVVARLLPLTYVVDLLRVACGQEGNLPAWLAVLALVVFASGFFVLSVTIMRKRTD